MIWAARTIEDHQESSLRELFRAQRDALGDPRNMMLVALRLDDERRRIYLNCHDFDCLPAYYGFDRIPREDLPRAPILLEGDPAAFEAMFQGWG